MGRRRRMEARGRAICKRERLVRAFGISVNRWEPANVMRALDTGLIDSVQVVYNVFDQAPEDELFPYCREHDIAVIARVPFDEGSLTGTLTRDSQWPEGDLRNILLQRREPAGNARTRRSARAARARGMDLPELALRFILEHPAVSTTIPGHAPAAACRTESRRPATASACRRASLAALRTHRWIGDRTVRYGTVESGFAAPAPALL